MLQRIRSYIREHRLLQEGDKVLVALSGGADSVALLYLLRACGYACEACHCNFHLRGEESLRDEQFVRELCAKWDTPLYVTDFATKEYANKHGISIEMAARDLRYAWFEQLRTAHGYAAIAVAHHQNDQAETLLLNLQRGTGIRGLCGMRPRNGYIIRPLLCVSRAEIEAFCSAEGLSYVTDSTNADTSYKRNAIRSIMQQAGEAEIRHYAKAAERMQAYQALIESLILGLPIPPDAQSALIYELLAPYGFNSTQIDNILQALPSSNKRFEAPDFTATIDHGELRIIKKDSAPPARVQTSDEEINAPITANTGKRESATRKNKIPFADKEPLLLRAVRPRRQKEHFPAATDEWAIVDADMLKEPITLRHWRTGDIFCPITNGQRITKKLQDYFCDQKLSVEEKDKVWIVCSDEDIVWIVGFRLDDRFKVTDQTKNIAELQIEE